MTVAYFAMLQGGKVEPAEFRALEEVDTKPGLRVQQQGEEADAVLSLTLEVQGDSTA